MDLGGELDALKVQAGPSAHNSLAWSEDGDLVLAAGEYVHIFTPKRRRVTDVAPTHVTGYRQWDSCRIKVNEFTEFESPSVAPETFETFSIGSEQSISTVCALAWSPAGLGKHRRSVLAVHTTNLVLSLWETNGEVGRWARIATVNKWLPQANGTTEPSINKRAWSNAPRIRSFCWSPPCWTRQSDCEKSWGTIYLAVVTDDHSLLITSLRNDKEPRKDQDEWKGNVILTIDLGPIQQPFPTGSIEPHSLFAEFMGQRSVETYVSWSPWIQQATTCSSFIAVSRGYEVELLQFSAKTLEPIQLVDLLDSSNAGRMSGPMSGSLGLSGRTMVPDCSGPFSWNTQPWNFSPGDMQPGTKPSSSVCISLLATTHKSPIILTISEQGECLNRNLLKTGLHNLNSENDCQDDLCIFTWTTGHDQSTEVNQNDRIYLASLSGRHKFLSYDARRTSVSSPSKAEWTDDIEEAIRSFALQYELGDAVELKVHGMASLGHRIAVCFRFRPSDMIEYTLPATTTSHILFHVANIQRKSPPETVKDRDGFEIMLGIFEWTMNRLYNMRGLYVSKTDRRLAWTQFRILLSASSDETEFMPYRAALTKFERDQDANLTEPKADEGEFPSHAVEICEICQSPLDVDSVDSTMCTNGHAYSRCSLSLLAIQEPGISKECSLCLKQYLDLAKADQYGDPGSHISFNTNGPSEDTPIEGYYPAPSTIKQLFETYDTCPYCNGKFRG